MRMIWCWINFLLYIVFYLASKNRLWVFLKIWSHSSSTGSFFTAATMSKTCLEATSKTLYNTIFSLFKLTEYWLVRSCSSPYDHSSTSPFSRRETLCFPRQYTYGQHEWVWSRTKDNRSRATICRLAVLWLSSNFLGFLRN